MIMWRASKKTDDYYIYEEVTQTDSFSTSLSGCYISRPNVLCIPHQALQPLCLQEYR